MRSTKQVGTTEMTMIGVVVAEFLELFDEKNNSNM